jgi:hypothetical protein
MGKRSRKRRFVPGEPRHEPLEPAVEPRRPPPALSRRARLDEAPKAPWSPFPLVELCIFIGLVLIVVGFVAAKALFVICGVALVGVASLELALREHFAGYRSHSSLLAGICAILAAIPVWLLPVPQPLVLLVGVVAFAIALFGFRRAFMRRSGGVGFRT